MSKFLSFLRMHSKSNHSQRCSRGLWPIKRYARTDHLYLATTILVYEYFVHNTKCNCLLWLTRLTSINNDSLEPSIKSKYNTNEVAEQTKRCGSLASPIHLPNRQSPTCRLSRKEMQQPYYQSSRKWFTPTNGVRTDRFSRN